MKYVALKYLLINFLVIESMDNFPISCVACPKGWIDYKNKKCLLHSDAEKLKFWNAHYKCIGNDARLISNLDTELLQFGKNQSWNDEYWTSSYRKSSNPTAFFWDYGWYLQPLGDISNWDLEATNDESKNEDCICVDGAIMKDIYCHKTGILKIQLFHTSSLIRE